ncbi:unnamed protein product [Onchocerca flexuosa]|uniref:Clathrin light chain n=1 Tax=Onchocerca flexuosa TaxID=387005 RepID=A0A3P7WV89_9BILA|nr:unnamed protein product [Onchocerca flexuosa]
MFTIIDGFFIILRKAEEDFISDREALKDGAEWERIAKLCEFNAKNSKTSRISVLIRCEISIGTNSRNVLAQIHEMYWEVDRKTSRVISWDGIISSMPQTFRDVLVKFCGLYYYALYLE